MKLILLVLLNLCVFAGERTQNILSLNNAVFTYFSSDSLESKNSNIETAVINISGSVENAQTYYNTINRIAAQTNNSEKTLIIAPQFKSYGNDHTYARNELRWSYWTDWTTGEYALGSKIRSFDVLDTFFLKLNNKINFPNLKKIILSGHSAGGQIVQRYAFATTIEDQLKNIKIRYIASNPGSYMYVSNKRILQGKMQVPRTSCDYNLYKYGLKRVHEYFTKKYNIDSLLERYLNKDVVYFLGEKDILTDIDQECGAQLQGATRLARGTNLKTILDYEFPAHNHQLVTLPDVGHTQHGMFTSDLGKKLVFGE